MVKHTSWAFVHSIAVFSANQLTTSQSLSNEATLVAQLALSDGQAAGHGAPTLVDVRQWALDSFPSLALTRSSPSPVSSMPVNSSGDLSFGDRQICQPPCAVRIEDESRPPAASSVSRL